jgi:DHA2 family multidrug resistance protein
MHHHTGPFAIPAINNTIPEKLKPLIMILFVIVFQFSGGIYLATLNEMVGATALLQEDIMMAGFASLAGMALVFTFMLRLKMRFTTKFAFLVCCIALIICNIICLYTNNVFVLVTTCFFAGMFRMWATFECNSTIQLWLTPKRDLSIFFCFIYLLVNGSILLSGVTNMYVAFFSGWEYMHWFIVGSLLMVMLVTLSIFNSKRFMRPFPLFGIDCITNLVKVPFHHFF